MTNKWISAVVVLGVSSLALHADTLRMRDGRLIPGMFEGADRNEVHFRPDGSESRSFPISDIDGVTFGGPVREGSAAGGGNYDRPRDQFRAGASDAERNYQQPSPPPPGGSLVIPAGTVISVRMLDSIDSDATHAGDVYRATLDQPLYVDGRLIARRGAEATVQVVRVRQGGRFEGREEVALALSSIRDEGRVIDLNTNNETVSSGSRGRQSGEVIGGGAVLGAIIGAIAGGGRGAAIGAAGGAAVGAGAEMVRGDRVKVHAETLLRFTLDRDIRI